MAGSPRLPGAGTATHCPYCALQCGMELSGAREAATIRGNASFPVNAGLLCVKGFHAGATLGHPQRLVAPLVRNARGALEPSSWEDALGLVSRRLAETQSRHGKSAVGLFGSGSLTNEKAYLLGKFARVALGTPNIDYNGRFCMSSAATAAIRAFGLDRGLPFPLEDIAGAEVVLLAGGNPAETLPPMMRHFDTQRARGGRLIVVDPRRSATARAAAMHLRLAPGSDAALANGLLHILIRDGLVDRAYVESRTEAFDQVRALAASYWPGRVERITGVPEAQLTQAAHLLGGARTAMVLTARGPEQQSQGVNNTLAYINLALALGMVGYHSLEGLSWIDALVNSAMLLGGMGPVNPLHTDAGKLFASFYALYSGLIFLIVAGVLFVPIFHRFLHRFHLELEEDGTTDD